MFRASRAICGLAFLLIALAGCNSTSANSTSSNQWRWPWQSANVSNEEYRLPPQADARFSNPPSFPKHTTTAGLKNESTESSRMPMMGLGPRNRSPSGSMMH